MALEAWVESIQLPVLEKDVLLLVAFVADGAVVGVLLVLLVLAHSAHELLVSTDWIGPIFFFRCRANSLAGFGAFSLAVLTESARFAALGAVGAGGGVGLRCRQILEPCCTS